VFTKSTRASEKLRRTH